jgi:hypothetical protein
LDVLGNALENLLFEYVEQSVSITTR